jgi:ATP-dependent DNA helicase UvrD/PcrA
VLASDEAEEYLKKAIGRLQIAPDQLKVYTNEQKNNGRLPHECVVETELERRKLEAYESYEQLLRKDNRVDFNDMLLLVVRLLEEHDDVRSRLYRRYRHILVDEYQDTNVIQARIIELLATSDDPAVADDAPHSLMVVGDAQQSIYLWRQAKYTLFTEFARYYPDVDVHPLKINYRSTRRII